MTKTEQIKEHCKQLKLTALASQLENTIAEAEKSQISYLELHQQAYGKGSGTQKKKGPKQTHFTSPAAIELQLGSVRLQRFQWPGETAA